MENNTVVTENTQPAEGSLGLTTEQLQEEQNARERYQKSVNPDADTSSNVPEGYNPDGTPIEEQEVNWETKYQELEIQHQLATNPNLYQTDSGVYDATDIINDFKATGVLSNEYRQELLSTGLTNEQIDEAVAKFGGTVKEPSTKSKDDGTQQTGSFNVKKFEAEYATTGRLSEESYSELSKLGFSKRDVDIYVNGQKEIARNFTNTLYEKVGGEQAYSELVQWSANNLDKATIERYNEAVSSNDRDAILSLVEYARFKKEGTTATNTKPNRISGDSSDVTAFAPFKDKTEWQRATSNKNYGKDIKYTNMVDNRYLVARRQGLI